MFRTLILTLLAATSALAITPHAYANTGATSAMTSPAQLTETQVRAAVARYFEGTRSMNARQWASAFASDAIVHDPVGSPPLTTPETILAQGEGFVTAFTQVGLTEVYVQVHGDEAMAYWTGRGTQKDGTRVVFEGINHFTFSPDGKITVLRGFWDPTGIRAE